MAKRNELPPQFRRGNRQPNTERKPLKSKNGTFKKDDATIIQRIVRALHLVPTEEGISRAPAKLTTPKKVVKRATKKTEIKAPSKTTKKKAVRSTAKKAAKTTKLKKVTRKATTKKTAKRTKTKRVKRKTTAKKRSAKKRVAQVGAVKKTRQEKKPEILFAQTKINLLKEQERKEKAAKVAEATKEKESITQPNEPAIRPFLVSGAQKKTSRKKKTKMFHLFSFISTKKPKRHTVKAWKSKPKQKKGKAFSLPEASKSTPLIKKAKTPKKHWWTRDTKHKKKKKRASQKMAMKLGITQNKVEEEAQEIEGAGEDEGALKKYEKERRKARDHQVKLLHKKVKTLSKERAEEINEEEKSTSKQLASDSNLAVEQRLKKAKLEAEEEEHERAKKTLDTAPEEIDIEALGMKMAKKKKKHGGISGVLKSINFIGMGKQRMVFIQNLAMMLNAGLPLSDSLKTLQLEIRSRAMRKVVQNISDLIDIGHPLWRAMDEMHFFTPYEVALVRVGEEAGNLARNMEYLAEQQEKDQALRQKVKMAMIYPSIVFVLMFIVVMGLGLFVLPNLVTVLYSLNADLPKATLVVIYITELFSLYGAQGVPLLILGMIVLAILAKYTALRRVSQWFVFKIPGIGRLAKEATIARFGVILGGLLEAGVPLVESLESLEEVTHIVSYKRFYGKFAKRIALGDSFSICFHDIKGSKKLIPPSMQQLIITGERSGTLSQTLMKVADIYEKKASYTADKLPTILEPMLLLIIGGMVGTIAFAIITPIYSVIGNVGR